MNIFTFWANNFKMKIFTFWTNNFNMNILGTQPASTSPKCIQDHPLCILLLQCTQVTHSQPLHPNSVSRIIFPIIGPKMSKCYFLIIGPKMSKCSLLIQQFVGGAPGSLLQLKDNIFNYWAKNV